MGRRGILVSVPLLVGAVAVCGCVTLRVNMDYDREADFAVYGTYAWQESEVSLADDNPLMHQRLIQAIDKELSAKGLQKTDATPDLLVTYHGESQEMVVLDRVSYYDGWYGYGAIGVSTTRARSYEQGTLVVDLVDAEANRLVWRGVATDTVAGSPDAQTKQIETATRQMFRRYPPAR